jgi:hypothetical protein
MDNNNTNLSFTNVSNRNNKKKSILTDAKTNKPIEAKANKASEPIETIPTEPIDPPKPNRGFNEKAREENEKYQQLRRQNKILASLGKMYNRTKQRNDQLKQSLLSNPLIIDDYKRILDAYNQNMKLDNDTFKILELFEYDEIPE